MNNVSLVGRLTKDPDMRFTPTGKAVTTFILAVNRNFTNQAGEREADFIACVAWGKTAETIANHLKKGSSIAVTGRIQTRNYDNSQGNRVYVTEVIVETFTFLEPKSKAEERQNSQSNQPANRQNYNQPITEGFPSDNDLPY